MPGPSADAARRSLVRDLRSLGLMAGQSVLVHASMRFIGPVDGGAGTVVAALMEVLGPAGTLVVPAATMGNSDTSRTYLARVAGLNAAEIRAYRAGMPAFDPGVTKPEDMGQVAEHVRLSPGAVRSAHPQTSFAALGSRAHELMAGHDLCSHLGEASPLARLYDAGGWVLLLGSSYFACSAFHLAEYRYTPNPPMRRYWCRIMENGCAVDREYEDVVLDDRDLVAIGDAFESEGAVTCGRVGGADSRFMPIVAAVDFAVQWLRRNRTDTRRPGRPASDLGE